jgi:predicted acyl esterase
VRNPLVTLRISLVATLLAGLSVAIVNAGAAGPSAVDAHGSVNQVYVTGVTPGTTLTLLDQSGNTVASRPANPLGGAVFYDVPEGTGYRVTLPDGTSSGALSVHDDAAAPWDPEVYGQTIPDSGYGYITTRDGIQLAYTVHPPTSPAGEGAPNMAPPQGPSGVEPDYAPPYPTLIEYSGYAYATPKGPTSGIAVLANAMGFAVVDVSMRGTGCSGGAYNFFEPLQNLDGYDVIETIAKQPWVKGHKVGMLGISYGAISQLFTAQLQPPSLEAITPLSTIDATATTLYPGGIKNTGFAVAWAAERQAQAQPAPNQGTQPYATDQINSGDTVCKNNQALHPDAEDLMQKIKENANYNPSVADPLDPITFVNKIKVPVFMACQFTDEQTGGHCPDLASHFTGTSQKWFTFTNGVHVDSLDPATYQRWYDFLELFVAHQAPAENAAVTQALSPVIYQQAMGLPQNDIVTMPPDPIQALPTYDLALNAYQQLPSVRVLFDNGAGTSPTGDTTAGNPYAGFEQSFPSWPIPGTATKHWYLGPDGSLNNEPATDQEIDTYTSDPLALPKTDFGVNGNTGGGGLWGNASQWTWDWRQNPAGKAVSYVTPPLTSNTAVIGAGAVHLWVRSPSGADVDLQATISEVTPDGHETFVQNGWIRGSERKLATDSNNILGEEPSDVNPIPTMLASDLQPMPNTDFTEVTIPLYYEGHVYRAGTRIRVTIAAPNGTQPIWSFDDTQPANGSTADVDIAFSPTMPSGLVLPVVPQVNVTTAQPACPSLRNEPCRTYSPIVNLTKAS